MRDGAILLVLAVALAVVCDLWDRFSARKAFRLNRYEERQRLPTLAWGVIVDPLREWIRCSDGQRFEHAVRFWRIRLPFLDWRQDYDCRRDLVRWCWHRWVLEWRSEWEHDWSTGATQPGGWRLHYEPVAR